MLFLWLPAPLAIFTGLYLFKNVSAAFVLFYCGVCLLIPFIDLMVIQGRKPIECLRYLGFRKFRGAILISFFSGAVLCFLIYYFFVLLQERIMNLETTGEVLKTWNIDRRSILWLVPVMVIANSLVEEVYWRGYIFLKLRETVSPLATIFLSSLFYASYHLLTTGALFSLNYALLCTSAVFAAGVFWAWIRYKTNSILVPLITHFFADLGVMLVYIRYFSS